LHKRASQAVLYDDDPLICRLISLPRLQRRALARNKATIR